MIGRVRKSRNPKKVIRVLLRESYGEIRRVPVNLSYIKLLSSILGIGDACKKIIVQYESVNNQKGEDL